MKDDTISRQAAIELAMQYCPDDDGSCSKADRDIRELLDDLENLPSAQPERKKGEWLTSDDMYETGICSCCRYDTQEPVSYVITNFEYCPNCGARMEETE